MKGIFLKLIHFFRPSFNMALYPFIDFLPTPLPSDNIRGYPPGTFLGTISGHISGYTDPTRPFWFLWGKIRRGEIHGSDTITLLQKTSGTLRARASPHGASLLGAFFQGKWHGGEGSAVERG